MREVQKLIGLVAHESRKHELLQLVNECSDYLRGEHLVCTATTGRIAADRFGLDVDFVASALQMAVPIAGGHVKLLVFLRDPFAAREGEPDPQALVSLCDVHRVPLATNVATARLCVRALATESRTALTAA